MPLRLLLHLAATAALLGFPAASAASGPEGMGHASPAGVLARLVTGAAGVLPRGEVTIQAEDGDYEARLSFTLLDRAPDWRRPGSVFRNFLREGLR